MVNERGSVGASAERVAMGMFRWAMRQAPA
jgi:hypothetical protein